MKTVLIVDDSKVIRTVAKRILEALSLSARVGASIQIKPI